jgi:cytochrome c553
MHRGSVFLGVACLALVLASAAAQADGQAKSQVCSACHGPDGNSTNPIWPNLAGQNASYIVAQLQAYKSGSRSDPSMSPMVANLEAADMEEIAAYYAAQPPRIAPATSPDLTVGEKLYRGGDTERGIPACMACHGPGGAGNAAARYPALRGQHPEYTVMQLKAYRDGARTTDPQTMMRLVAERLSEADMQHLANYIAALH